MRINLLALITAVLLSGCGGGSSAPSELVGKHDANAASCLYGFNEGEMAPSSLPAPNIQSAAFNKPYDQNLFNSVGSASGAEVLRFSALTGVTFYKVDKRKNKTIGCLFTGTLPNAPTLIEKKFREIEGDTQSEDPDSSLLGIYMPSETVQSLTDFAYSENMIVVLNDSEKYTMVHEFMHHLFKLGKKESDGMIKNRLIRSFELYEAAEEKFKSNETAANLIHFSTQLERLVIDLIPFLRSFHLEEVALETEMYKHYSRGKLRYISEDSRRNGDWYITSSGESTQNLIKELKITNNLVLISNKARMLDLTDLDKASVLESTDKANQLISNVNSELNTLIQQAHARLQKSNFRRTRSGLVASSSSPHEGCAHRRQAAQFVREILKK